METYFCVTLLAGFGIGRLYFGRLASNLIAGLSPGERDRIESARDGTGCFRVD